MLWYSQKSIIFTPLPFPCLAPILSSKLLLYEGCKNVPAIAHILEKGVYILKRTFPHIRLYHDSLIFPFVSPSGDTDIYKEWDSLFNYQIIRFC